MKGVRCWAMRWAIASALTTVQTRWLQELRWRAQAAFPVANKEEDYLGGIKNLQHHCWRDTATVAESAGNHPGPRRVQSSGRCRGLTLSPERTLKVRSSSWFYSWRGWGTGRLNVLPKHYMCPSVIELELKAVLPFVCFIILPLSHIAV